MKVVCVAGAVIAAIVMYAGAFPPEWGGHAYVTVFSVAVAAGFVVGKVVHA